MKPNQPNHIIFLTSTNLASNPRCLKEVRLLAAAGVKLTVVAFNLHNWTNEKETQLHKELPGVSFRYLETTNRNLFPWLISSLLERMAGSMLLSYSGSIYRAALCVSKRSWLLLRWVKKYKGEADLVIAHNPPAFYAAYRLAFKRNIPFALDIEDYHPGEGNNKTLQDAVAYLMTKLLPKALYVSFASSLIKSETEKLLHIKATDQFITINNTFSVLEFLSPLAKAAMPAKVSLVWFSQFIDYGRGLEKILPVTDLFPGTVTLTLIGTARPSFYDNEIKNREYIECLPAMSQRELNQALHQYDIGLAIEDSKADMNRDICLTNKIWAYLQSGLYIIASDTSAQKLFMQQHEQHGTCTSLEAVHLTTALINAQKNIEQIREARQERFTAASAYCWENESALLIKEWDKIISVPIQTTNILN